ncbi:nucleoside phosphorylase domain-containing protein [Ilyonectria destructans]|nr:nucleoside phosphorylase domain-containing protein [Ilyonectria destructans]
MSNPRDYTVGFICAKYFEYAVTKVFLDKEHPEPETVAKNDQNDYTVGKMGKHMVVIATLPDGATGNSDATAVARNMMHTFPNVRFGLLVGVGGGVPNQQNDIRLGDIIKQDFKPTGFLNNPPVVLRTAVTRIRGDHEIHGHEIEDTINGILERNLTMREGYKRPDAESDPQFRPRIDQLNIDSMSDDSSPEEQYKRSGVDGSIAIHYGTIASASDPMKDGEIRDKIASQMKILCFETGAAGLMNQFPCIVIRVVSDYAGSTKIEAWEKYTQR